MRSCASRSALATPVLCASMPRTNSSTVTCGTQAAIRADGRTSVMSRISDAIQCRPFPSASTLLGSTAGLHEEETHLAIACRVELGEELVHFIIGKAKTELL